MHKFVTIRTFRRSRWHNLPPKFRQSKAGYTLVELLVVVGIIAVIAAIASPSWLGFVQQRRVNSANDSVLRALQEAQSKAKTQKLSYSVSFRTQNGVPQVAVYPDSATPANNSWKQLGEQLSLKPGQIWIGTNVASSQSNTATTNLIPIDATGVEVVTFNNSGALPTTINTNLGTQGLIIAVGAAQPGSNSSRVLDSTRRCVKISTLLGSIQTGKIIDNTTTGPSCNPIQ
jgi:prepilin-type N-terminal cleavage/methylation domain-containing protein